MIRCVRLVGFCAILSLFLLSPVGGQQAAARKPAYLTVLVPDEEAHLLVDGKATKQTGNKRLFVSPPLEAGKTYTYTLVAKWEPNNYTKITRTRDVTVKAGQELEVDLRNADPKVPDKFLIRFVPTPDEVVEAMCKLAKVGKGDVVYDLGCGDGRIVITAIKDFGAKRGLGVDIDPERVADSRKAAKEAGLTDKVEFRKADVLTLKDLGDASVVMMYMGEDVNLQMRPILKKTLKPGSRIVSHDFRMGDWMPEKTVKITDTTGDEHEIFLWTIGAKKK